MSAIDIAVCVGLLVLIYVGEAVISSFIDKEDDH